MPLQDKNSRLSVEKLRKDLVDTTELNTATASEISSHESTFSHDAKLLSDNAHNALAAGDQYPNGVSVMKGLADGWPSNDEGTITTFKANADFAQQQYMSKTDDVLYYRKWDNTSLGADDDFSTFDTNRWEESQLTTSSFPTISESGRLKLTADQNNRVIVRSKFFMPGDCSFQIYFPFADSTGIHSDTAEIRVQNQARHAVGNNNGATSSEIQIKNVSGWDAPTTTPKLYLAYAGSNFGFTNINTTGSPAGQRWLAAGNYYFRFRRTSNQWFVGVGTDGINFDEVMIGANDGVFDVDAPVGLDDAYVSLTAYTSQVTNRVVYFDDFKVNSGTVSFVGGNPSIWSDWQSVADAAPLMTTHTTAYDHATFVAQGDIDTAVTGHETNFNHGAAMLTNNQNDGDALLSVYPDGYSGMGVLDATWPDGTVDGVVNTLKVSDTEGQQIYTAENNNVYTRSWFNGELVGFNPNDDFSTLDLTRWNNEHDVDDPQATGAGQVRIGMTGLFSRFSFDPTADFSWILDVKVGTLMPLQNYTFALKFYNEQNWDNRIPGGRFDLSIDAANLITLKGDDSAAVVTGKALAVDDIFQVKYEYTQATDAITFTFIFPDATEFSFSNTMALTGLTPYINLWGLWAGEAFSHLDNFTMLTGNVIAPTLSEWNAWSQMADKAYVDASSPTYVNEGFTFNGVGTPDGVVTDGKVNDLFLDTATDSFYLKTALPSTWELQNITPDLTNYIQTGADATLGSLSISSETNNVSSVNHAGLGIGYNETNNTSTFAMVGTKSQVSYSDGGDDARLLYTIPFTFTYFGIDYTQLSIGTNGIIYLGDDSQNYSTWFPSILATFEWPFIAPLATDLIVEPATNKLTINSGGTGYAAGGTQTYIDAVGTNSRTGETILCAVAVTSGVVTNVGIYSDVGQGVMITGLDWLATDTITFDNAALGGGTGLSVTAIDGLARDIYIQENVNDVVITWFASQYGESEIIRFSCTLADTGNITFKYGAFDAPVGPTLLGLNDGIGVAMPTSMYNDGIQFGGVNDLVYTYNGGTRAAGNIASWSDNDIEKAWISDSGMFNTKSGINASGAINSDGYTINGVTMVDMPNNSSVGVGTSVIGSSNTFVGKYSTNSLTISASNNTVLGSYATADLANAMNNTIIGASAGRYISTERDNTAVGQKAMDGISGYGTSIGYWSGTTGTYNIAIGHTAGYYNTGQHSISIGRRASNPFPAGARLDYNFHIAIGNDTHKKITTGTHNISLGHEAGNVTTTGSHVISIGNEAAPSDPTASYVCIIGNATNPTKVGIGGNLNPQFAMDVNGDVNVTGTFKVGGVDFVSGITQGDAINPIEKGAANGVAPLDANSKVLNTYLEDSMFVSQAGGDFPLNDEFDWVGKMDTNGISPLTPLWNDAWGPEGIGGSAVFNYGDGSDLNANYDIDAGQNFEYEYEITMLDFAAKYASDDSSEMWAGGNDPIKWLGIGYYKSTWGGAYKPNDFTVDGWYLSNDSFSDGNPSVYLSADTGPITVQFRIGRRNGDTIYHQYQYAGGGWIEFPATATHAGTYRPYFMYNSYGGVDGAKLNYVRYNVEPTVTFYQGSAPVNTVLVPLGTALGQPNGIAPLNASGQIDGAYVNITGGLTRIRTTYVDVAGGSAEFSTGTTFTSIADVDVFLNGMRLLAGNEFTDSVVLPGQNITLGGLTVVGDDLEIIIWKVV